MSPAPAAGRSGVLGVLKPPGMTSHDVVRIARRVLGTRRIGHAGTLDPLAAGVLPLLVGAATRLADLLLCLPKTYRAEVVFGVASDTGDLGGRVVADAAPPQLGRGAVLEAVEGLAGRRVQTPPAYSARQVGGRRLYDIARSAGGVPDEVLAETAREIEVYDAELLGYRQVESGPLAGHQAALITVTCSSGTYVRELAEQAGRALGTPACLSFLVRTRTAGVALDDCVTMEQLLEMYGSPGWVRRHGAAWRSPSEAVGFLPAAVLDDAGVMRVVNSGAPVPRSAAVADAQVSIPKTLNDALAASGFTGYTRLLDRELNLLALARCEGSMYRPVKVLALAGERGMA